MLFVNDMPELTVEQLVLNAAKPYHDLFFGRQTRDLSADRLAQFPSWGAIALAPVIATAPPACFSAQHVSTNVTPKDIEAGQVRASRSARPRGCCRLVGSTSGLCSAVDI